MDLIGTETFPVAKRAYDEVSLKYDRLRSKDLIAIVAL